MLTRNILFILFFCIGQIVWSQLEREGTPVSWYIGADLVGNTVWKTLPALDTEALFAEDMANEDKSVPYRFAYAQTVDYSPDNAGKWSNMQNGDRIWVLGLDCPNAISIGLTFSHLQLPRGARLYIYSQDRQDYIGPLNSSENTTMPICTPPVNGSRIIIEYYEPYAYRGHGHFSIDKVTGAYRNLRDPFAFQVNDCIEMLEVGQVNNDIRSASSSMLMMLVDNGQRVATATLLNNTSNDGTPYVVTAANALMGLPSSWIFLFDVKGSGCLGGNQNCSNSAICGAQVMESNDPNGITLLRLNNAPRNNWRAFYTGWKLGAIDNTQDYFCLQHALGLPQSFASYHSYLSPSEWNGHATFTLNPAYAGGTFQGSVGSPLFDDDMKLVGLFVGGDTDCDGFGKDHFALIASDWTRLDNYLDPFAFHSDRLEGLYPTNEESVGTSQELNVFFFPNPAQSWIYVQNDGDAAISQVIIRDAGGRVIKNLSPKVPTIDLEDLPKGFYTITFISGMKVSTQSLMIL